MKRRNFFSRRLIQRENSKSWENLPNNKDTIWLFLYLLFQSATIFFRINGTFVSLTLYTFFLAGSARTRAGSKNEASFCTRKKKVVLGLVNYLPTRRVIFDKLVGTDTHLKIDMHGVSYVLTIRKVE